MRILNHDKDRDARCGVPEVVYGEGKSAGDLIEISESFLACSGRVIVTRVDDEKAAKVLQSVEGKGLQIVHNIKGRVLVVRRKDFKKGDTAGVVGIITAGTSDIPVAEEAAAIAEELGCSVKREYDVGIAGIHRVFSALERMGSVNACIVAAGMEGALPSVVAGLVAAPVIAVPTSVGYGTAERGRTALYTMLNSCTPLAVVNIDNGYGAAVLAYKMIRSCGTVNR